MTKIALFALLLGAVFIPDCSAAYLNMANQSNIANQLNMNVRDYTFSMAIAGTLTGFGFGMFLWKVR